MTATVYTQGDRVTWLVQASPTEGVVVFGTSDAGDQPEQLTPDEAEMLGRMLVAAAEMARRNEDRPR